MARSRFRQFKRFRQAVFNRPVVLNVAGSMWPMANVKSGTVGESCRIQYRNNSGHTLTDIFVDFGNWYNLVTGEVDNPNDISIECALEDASNNVFPLNMQGAARGVLAPGEDGTFSGFGMSIAPGALFWIRCDVEPAAGGTYPIAYLGAGTFTTTAKNREAYVSPTVMSYKARSGATISGVNNQQMFAPLAIRATTPNRFSFGAIGDSWIQGSGDGAQSSDFSQGIYGRACAVTGGAGVPYMQIGYAGAKVKDHHTLAKCQRRIRMMARALSHCAIEYGINDVVDSGTTLAAIKADLLALATLIKDAGVKPIAHTIGPRTGSTDTWDTVANQTPSASYIAGTNGVTGANSTVTQELNDWLRTIPAPFHDVFDCADAVMSARNSGRWAINAAWTPPRYVADGVHPARTGTATGGVFAGRDALLTKVQLWQSQVN
ncbi:SGNH hydrolase-type protein [Rhizobium phage RHph_X2_24]|nr:SGNH hydrolase-type protein [Rhizobium phage RHph_X2_24]